MARLCLAGDTNGGKSGRDVQSCAVCFVQIDLLEFEILGRTKCWLEVSIQLSGSGGFCFLKYEDTTEAVELSTETTFISHAGLFSFCCGNTTVVLSRPSPNHQTP